MEEGNTAMAGGAAITKNAPNLVAAQAMMDILSVLSSRVPAPKSLPAVAPTATAT